jgi:anti-sigma-K factor RskA
MGNVIPLHGDPHETAQRLLPWYVTGTLDAAEHRLVEDHLAHCAECAAELAGEERLRAEVAALPDAPAGQWEKLRDRALASAASSRRGASWWSALPTGRRIALAAASQAALVLLGIGVYDRLRQPAEGAYHTLSAPEAKGAQGGNIIVIFRPDSPEQAFRATIDAVGARLVDGPTAAGAYVLAVPDGRREAALAMLRKRADIVLAQPIDGERAQ